MLHFETLAKLGDDAGLATTANYARSVIDYIHNNETYQIDHMDETVRSARRFLYEEMRSWLYFEIPQHQVQYWMDTTPFGPAVAAEFPDAGYDIEEASKCLAVDRTTACVFHLMRALDFALAFLSAHLGSTVDPLRTWGPILKGVADEIGKMPESTPAEKTKKEDYWRIHGHLSAVKNAWRNPTMHPRKSYDVEAAEDIFCATRGFLREIARVIP